MKKERGITLIALVITIIVLLILAGVSISLVVGNNGVLTQATNAVSKNRESAAKEDVEMAWAGAVSKYWSDWANDSSAQKDETFFKTELEGPIANGIITNVEKSGNKYIIDYTANDQNKDYTFLIDENGNAERLGKWTANENGGFTNSTTGEELRIGDIIQYDATKDENGETLTASYTSYSKNNASADKNNGRTNGGGQDYTFNVGQITNKNWRVLGVNENGQIEIISPDSITYTTATSSTSYVNFAGYASYLSYSGELNAICDLFGHGKGAESSRSFKREDIDKLAGIKTDADKKSLNSNYGDKIKYRFPTFEQASNVNENDSPKNEGDTLYLQYKRKTGSTWGLWTDITDDNYQVFHIGTTQSISNGAKGESAEFTDNCYAYEVASRVTLKARDNRNMSDVFVRGTGTGGGMQWQFLDNQLVGLSSNSKSISYRVACIGYFSTIDMGTQTLSLSGGSTSYDQCGAGGKIRPVVALKLDVKLEPNGNAIGNWNIK